MPEAEAKREVTASRDLSVSVRRAIGAATRPLHRPRRSEHRPELGTEHLAPEVIARLRGYTPGDISRDGDDARGDSGGADTPAEAPPSEPRLRGTGWLVRAGLALVAVALVALAVTVVSHHRRNAVAVQPPPSAQAQVAPMRSAFSNPRDYAAAVTRSTLAAVGTELDGKPTCDGRSRWNRWSCLARGKPTLGAYAGRVLTFRCSPSYHRQPGGRPSALMIDCKPTELPR